MNNFLGDSGSSRDDVKGARNDVIMKIAVYSGSFNPLHIGHLAIMKHVTEVAGFDCVYLIVSPKNPFKSEMDGSTGRQRYEAAVEAVKRHPELKVHVDDIELSMPEPHYTIRTLDSLKAREAENDFTLIIGADNLAEITLWKEGPRILRDYGVASFPRKGFDMDKLKKDLLTEDPSYKIMILDAETVDISSSQIRNSSKDMSDWLM